METADEFVVRYFATPVQADDSGERQLARMVAARDAERDTAIRKEYESHPPMLVENERQKRIDETARAIIQGWAASGRLIFIPSATEQAGLIFRTARDYAELDEAERERRLKR